MINVFWMWSRGSFTFYICDFQLDTRLKSGVLPKSKSSLENVANQPHKITFLFLQLLK